jgi:cytochrome d ubiquinol oxidase subunit II
METLWFWLIAVAIAMYVIFDGFDIGTGILHFLAARDVEERARMFRVIGPVWDGNEVWLLAGGGTLYFAFPALYAASFSGFYLPLMIVLWLLILRGISIEFRNHVESHLWMPFWDAVFSGSSMALAVFFGAALGNVVRGVPLDESGFFFLPLWVDFRVPSAGNGAGLTGVLDWYTIVVGVAALLTLAMHGSLWVILKTSGAVGDRARVLFQRLWWAVGVSTLAITALSFYVQPHLRESFQHAPWGFVFPALALAGLLGARLLEEAPAFLASCAYIAGMLCSVAFGIFPYVLPSNGGARTALTVYNSAAASHGLHVGLAWWIPGMCLVTGYFIFTYRQFAGKVE